MGLTGTKANPSGKKVPNPVVRMGKMVKVNGKMVYNPYLKVTKSDIFFQPKIYKTPQAKNNNPAEAKQAKQVISDYEETSVDKRKVKATKLVWKSDHFATNPVEDGSWHVKELLRDLQGMRFFRLCCYIGFGVHASCVKNPWVFQHTMEVLSQVEKTDGNIRKFLILPKEESEQYEKKMDRVVAAIMEKLKSYDGKAEGKHSCYAIANRIRKYKEKIRVSQKLPRGRYVHLMDPDLLDDSNRTKKGYLMHYFQPK